MKKSEIFTADMKKSWVPSFDGVNFGKNEEIPVKGWFVSGVVAKIMWNLDAHFLIRMKGGMVTVKVNGKNVSNQQALNGGEKIQIGSSNFVYVVTE